MADSRYLQGTGGAIELTDVPPPGTVRGDHLRERIANGDLTELDPAVLAVYEADGSTLVVFAELAPEGARPAELPADTERVDPEPAPVELEQLPAEDPDATAELEATELDSEDADPELEA